MSDLDPLGFREPPEDPTREMELERERVDSAFDVTFSGPIGSVVLEALYDFIRPDDPTIAIAATPDGQAQDLDPSGRISASNEGRRAVWLYIQNRRRAARGALRRKQDDASAAPDTAGTEPAGADPA